MIKLLSALKNVTYTENMAVSNASTNSRVLDFYFHAPARRGQDITDLFQDALTEDELLALKAMFYLRDIRGGKGERELFRQLLRYLNIKNENLLNALFRLVPEYGRWDDLIEFVDNPNVVRLVKTQLRDDLHSENPSLLAKWMPSVNTSSSKTIDLAYRWMRALGIEHASVYRKNLASIRKRLEIVEGKMSANEWGEINYSRVPSKANLLYRKAFSRRDGKRYGEFINDAKQGKVKINSGVLYPHEIVGNCLDSSNDTLDALWKQLPNYTGDKNALVVADVSGSMSFESARLPKSKFYALHVSIALAIYFADKNTGPFAKHFITFSANPQLVELTDETLYDKIRRVAYNGGTNTNLQAVFDVLLQTAKRNKVSQKDMPEVIFICSDMQFDALDGNNETNFEAAKRKYALSGYDLPKLVFWNLASRRLESPVTKDDNGVFLASGFSTDTFEKVLNLDEAKLPVTTPHEMMLLVLNSDRYAPVEEAYNNYKESI